MLLKIFVNLDLALFKIGILEIQNWTEAMCIGLFFLHDCLSYVFVKKILSLLLSVLKTLNWSLNYVLFFRNKVILF